MKSAVLFLLVVAAAAAERLQPNTRYHETEGIPRMQEIQRLEEGTDFDGGRIWGGQAVGAGTQPHLGGLVITLTTGQLSICGSSLISNTRSVTAAHCWRTNTFQARQFTVVWGSNALMSGGTRVVTTNVVVHPQYNANNLNNDVAVIRHNSVAFNNVINRIALATGSNSFAGTWAVAAGYGRNGDGAGSSNPGKSQANLLVITNDVCRQTFGNTIVASTLCVSTAHGSSTCPGDSGGPLAVGSGNNRQLIGITSFGTQWCARGFPAGFARVTSFASWLSSQ
uniref:Chymotrypsin-like serine protease n=1 Tax=Ostrinia nubilalis TaxID=29057 RepID=Q56IC0_OSTNU|nr:chymotrypsin-like serine protease [Ostrinia nubilalis]AAX62030.1 chymotrypsin-like serine protease [Ostrinia nubilalis]